MCSDIEDNCGLICWLIHGYSNNLIMLALGKQEKIP
jgi:hypothetical protein